VQKVKCDLSNDPAATFQFSDGFVDLRAMVERTSFEEWVSEELGQIAQRVDSLLDSSGILPKDVDMVFLTGGSSFVPAVRKIFEVRFGEKRIRGGNEFTSIARGLALKAMDSQYPASPPSNKRKCLDQEILFAPGLRQLPTSRARRSASMSLDRVGAKLLHARGKRVKGLQGGKGISAGVLGSLSVEQRGQKRAGGSGITQALCGKACTWPDVQSYSRGWQRSK